MANMILSWDKQASPDGLLYPVSREGHSVTFIPGEGILMFGGLGANLFSDLYSYSPSEHRWELVPISGRYPTPRCYHQAFYMGKLLITRTLFCGIRRPG